MAIPSPAPKRSRPVPTPPGAYAIATPGIMTLKSTVDAYATTWLAAGENAKSILLGCHTIGRARENPRRHSSDLIVPFPIATLSNVPTVLMRDRPSLVPKPSRPIFVHSYALAPAFNEVSTLFPSPAGLYQLAPASLVRARKAPASMPSRWPTGRRSELGRIRFGGTATVCATIAKGSRSTPPAYGRAGGRGVEP